MRNEELRKIYSLRRKLNYLKRAAEIDSLLLQMKKQSTRE